MHYAERRAQYRSQLEQFFGRVDDGEIQIVTSVVTYLECVVKPLREGREDLVQRFRAMLFETRNIDVMDVTPAISAIAAEVRAHGNLKTPDAIQFATAIDRQASFFLTNDYRIPSTEDIQVVVLSELDA